MDKHWISLCKVNRPDKNRDIWMLRLADAVGGVLVAPYFDKQKEQIHDNRLFVFAMTAQRNPVASAFGSGKNLRVSLDDGKQRPPTWSKHPLSRLLFSMKFPI